MRLGSFWPKREPVLERGRLYEEVRRALEEVRPYARSHGGEIRLRGVTALGDVLISFEGACHACPLSEITLKLTVETHLRETVPGVRKVKRA